MIVQNAEVELEELANTRTVRKWLRWFIPCWNHQRWKGLELYDGEFNDVAIGTNVPLSNSVDYSSTDEDGTCPGPSHFVL